MKSRTYGGYDPVGHGHWTKRDLKGFLNWGRMVGVKDERLQELRAEIRTAKDMLRRLQDFGLDD
jgi:hypothetical protein